MKSNMNLKKALAIAIVLIFLLPSAIMAAPLPPTNPAATVEAGPPMAVALTWTPTPNAGHRVMRAVAPGTDFAQVGADFFGAITFPVLDDTVTDGVTYSYQVVAFDGTGASPPSDTVSITVGLPAAPTDLFAIVMSATKVDLIWTDQANSETGFRIERSLDNFATTPSTTFPADPNQRTFSDTSVSATNTYSYRVVAVNGIGVSAPSNTATSSVTAKLQVGTIDPAFIFQGNPNTSFPGYYQDDQGTRVSLLPISGNGATAPTQIFEPVDPANPYSVFLGMGEEAFYYIATADFTTATGWGHLRFAVEANVAVPGEEVVFTRSRIRINFPVPGTYTVQHPYGTNTFDVTQDDIDARGGIFFTEDIGLAARNFALATSGPISRFLHQTAPPPPAGWIGDGVSVGPVTGSPTGFNKVIVTGPVGVNLNGAGSNVIETDQFSVSARLATAVAPIPSFTKVLDPVTGIAPTTVTFTDTSSGPPTAWLWEFGDGTTSTLQNPSKTYDSAGNYLIRLTVTNAAAVVSTSQTLNVYVAPVANFTSSLPNGVPPVAINFTDTSTGNPSSWSWAFGDGATSTLQNPSHTYAAAGTYTVTLTVTSPAGTAAVSKTVNISPNLTAGFTKVAAPATGIAPVAVTFTDTSVGTITGWLWDFGDGTTSMLQNPPDKTYADAGNYTVTLAVTDASGSAGTSQVVSVFSLPVASFTKSTDRGVPPLIVSFTDTSTGNPASWLWDFGDGTTSTLQNPSKTYAIPQNYTVTLTVTNAAGTASTSQVVMVSAVFGNPAVQLNLQMGPIDQRFIF